MLWYIAYGSNLQPRLLARYLPRAESRPSRRLVIPHRLFFAGRSLRWDGGVAFLTLTPEGQRTPARAYEVTAEDLLLLVQGENGVPVDFRSALTTLAPGEWASVLVQPPVDPRTGKYDALLRLDDLEGRPAYTVTTSQRLVEAAPSTEYLEAIRVGRGMGPVPSGVSEEKRDGEDERARS